MPNWCDNTLTITGTPERIAQLRQALGDNGEPLQLARLNPHEPSDEDVRAHPMGQALQAISGEVGWYESNIARFGTKWEISDVSEEVADDSVTYYFSSAWSPPVEAVEAFVAENRDVHVRLEYDEPGMDFSGYQEWTNGTETAQFHGASRNVWCEVCEAPTLVDFEDPRECAETPQAREHHARGIADISDVYHLWRAGELSERDIRRVLTDESWAEQFPQQHDIHAHLVRELVEAVGRNLSGDIAADATQVEDMLIPAVQHRVSDIAAAARRAIPAPLVQHWTHGTTIQRAAASLVVAETLN